MARRGYNAQQIQRQQANSIRRQESSPTTVNSSENSVEYNNATVSGVPSEVRGLDKLIEYGTKYGGWIAFTVTIAGAIGAFLNFQSDLKRAESDIKSAKTLADKNSSKLVDLDKIYAEINKDVTYMQGDISSIETSIEKSNDKLEQVTLKQLKLEYSAKKEIKNKQGNQG
ncbi:MAG TPA: hypothetical protein DEO86_06970 [Colwellia sp.]|nr:hypothetical protein [Colwellia sp.]|tara:strand:- start:1184 stop:1693 length:510 start_codon:yes stop_codon:yes gene_type:complete